jgi:hypothetical protein
MGIIFTEAKFQEVALDLKLFSPDKKDWIAGNLHRLYWKNILKRS